MQENQPIPSAPGNQDSQRTPESQRALSLRAALDIRRDIMASTALPLTRNKSEKLSAFKQKVAQLTEQLVAAKQEIAEKDAEIEALDGRLGRVTQAWADLDEQADALQEKLALSEQRIQAHADDYLTATMENGDLQRQLTAAQEELAAIRAREAHREEVDHDNMSTLFREVLKLCSESEQDGEQMAAAKRLVDGRPGSREAALAVREALSRLIHAWARDMKDLQGSITEFEQVTLAELDARIGNIARHREAIRQLAESDLENWHAALSGRRRLGHMKEELLLHRELAREALYTVHLALKKQSTAHVLDSSIRVAHRLVQYTLELEYSMSRGFAYYALDGDLSRSFYAVQDAIEKLVASGKAYSAPSEESASYSASSVPAEWRLTVPAPSAPEFAFEQSANPTMDLSSTGGFSSTADDYFSDFAINPANGVPMNGGMGGTDWYGNSYGSNLNDPW